MKKLMAEPEVPSTVGDGVPIFLFGNVLPDPEAFSLFESCGARIAGEDLCTGSRLFSPAEVGGAQEVMPGLARSLLSRPPCARTLDPSQPGKMGEDILAKAKECNARGVIGHTVKFCDPYLDRLPGVREVLRDGGVPLLLLEGDCTMRSMGQQRTRIEAFIEMLR
jgi:benzoyl-CoA reductase/2-hydroxyglutaryl-CoA dehydratase subunit BcrC/BadD/HgdB